MKTKNPNILILNILGNLLAEKEDTKEWYACFMPVDLNYCIAAEVYLEGKWVEIAKNKDEQFLVSTINKAMKVGRFFTD